MPVATQTRANRATQDERNCRAQRKKAIKRRQSARLPKDLTKEEKDPASKYKIAINAAWLLIQLQLALFTI